MSPDALSKKANQLNTRPAHQAAYAAHKSAYESAYHKNNEAKTEHHFGMMAHHSEALRSPTLNQNQVVVRKGRRRA